LNEVPILIQNATKPCDDATAAAGNGFACEDRRHDVDRVPEEDRAVKLPFQDAQECQCVDSRRLARKTRGDGQTKESVRDWAAEGVAGLRRMINVEWIEIAREARKAHDVRLGDRPPRTYPFVARDEIIE